jgi:hypothetical protein
LPLCGNNAAKRVGCEEGEKMNSAIGPSCFSGGTAMTTKRIIGLCLDQVGLKALVY